MLIAIVYFSIAIPFRVGFSAPAAGLVASVEDSCTLLFIVDIAVKVTVLLLVKLAAARIVVAALPVIVLLQAARVQPTSLDP